MCAHYVPESQGRGYVLRRESDPESDPDLSATETVHESRTYRSHQDRPTDGDQRRHAELRVRKVDAVPQGSRVRSAVTDRDGQSLDLHGREIKALNQKMDALSSRFATQEAAILEIQKIVEELRRSLPRYTTPAISSRTRQAF